LRCFVWQQVQNLAYRIERAFRDSDFSESRVLHWQFFRVADLV